MTDLAAFASQEYSRRKARAAKLAAANPAQRAAIERRLRCWLAIVLAAGGEHPDARPLLAEQQRLSPNVTPAQAGALARAELVAVHLWHTELARARDAALHALDRPRRAGGDPAQQDRARNLQQLCHALGVTLPIVIPAQAGTQPPQGLAA